MNPWIEYDHCQYCGCGPLAPSEVDDDGFPMCDDCWDDWVEEMWEYDRQYDWDDWYEYW